MIPHILRYRCVSLKFAKTGTLVAMVALERRIIIKIILRHVILRVFSDTNWAFALQLLVYR